MNPNYYPHGDNYIQFSGYCMFSLQPYHLPNLPGRRVCHGPLTHWLMALASAITNNLAGAAEFEAYTNRLRALS